VQDATTRCTTITTSSTAATATKDTAYCAVVKTVPDAIAKWIKYTRLPNANYVIVVPNPSTYSSLLAKPTTAPNVSSPDCHHSSAPPSPNPHHSWSCLAAIPSKHRNWFSFTRASTALFAPGSTVVCRTVTWWMAIGVVSSVSSTRRRKWGN
jgi:hypothetical protein